MRNAKCKNKKHEKYKKTRRMKDLSAGPSSPDPKSEITLFFVGFVHSTLVLESFRYAKTII